MPNVSYLLEGIVHLEYHQQPLLAQSANCAESRDSRLSQEWRSFKELNPTLHTNM
jgi:hypothetical protein